jgi:hypothetical protein
MDCGPEEDDPFHSGSRKQGEHEVFRFRWGIGDG